MAHVSSGGPATSAQYNAHDDRIANLEANALSTGGSVGSASLDKNVGWNKETTKIGGTNSGSVLINHNLGFTPSVVLVNIQGNPNTGVALYAAHHTGLYTSSTFTVYFGNIKPSGSSYVWDPAVQGQDITFGWIGLP